MNYYQSKLAYETDSADLYEAIENGEPVVVVDGRAAGAYVKRQELCTSKVRDRQEL